MKRESFRSRLGFLLVSAGCAIGIGNVWRFPYIAGKNGGGYFVLFYLLCLLVNVILHSLTDLENLNAVLPIPSALLFVAISVLLTLIAGIIPSRSASKKDPVVALRSE